MDDRPSELVCDAIKRAEIVRPAQGADYKRLYLRLPTYDREKFDQINRLLEEQGAEVILYCEDTKKRYRAAKFANFHRNSEQWVKICKILGENNVKAVD